MLLDYQSSDTHYHASDYKDLARVSIDTMTAHLFSSGSFLAPGGDVFTAPPDPWWRGGYGYPIHTCTPPVSLLFLPFRVTSSLAPSPQPSPWHPSLTPLIHQLFLGTTLVPMPPLRYISLYRPFRGLLSPYLPWSLFLLHQYIALSLYHRSSSLSLLPCLLSVIFIDG